MTAKDDRITCLICDEDLTGSNQHMLLIHALTRHPVEFMTSESVLAKLGYLSNEIFALGGALAERLVKRRV